jgi:hypothetical protein
LGGGADYGVDFVRGLGEEVSELQSDLQLAKLVLVWILQRDRVWNGYLAVPTNNNYVLRHF